MSVQKENLTLNREFDFKSIAFEKKFFFVILVQMFTN